VTVVALMGFLSILCLAVMLGYVMGYTARGEEMKCQVCRAALPPSNEQIVVCAEPDCKARNWRPLELPHRWWQHILRLFEKGPK